MGFQIEVLQADHGDSILISSVHGSKTRNILIDGGPKKTFSQRNRSRALQKKLNLLKEKNQQIDLLILTHVDADHIGGILAGFEKEGYLSEMVREVWFNSGQLISEYFDEPLDEQHLLELKKYSSGNTSIRQGVVFESVITELGVWRRKIIKSGDVLERFGLTFKVLSPSDDQLKSLLKKWKRERPSSLTSSKSDDYEFKLEELIESDFFKEDTSVHNASSISFILEHEGKAALFLGDAHPSTVSDSLKGLGFSSEKMIPLEYVKVSHHGSKGNTDNELLSLLDCQKFIISTDGSKHRLPNKRTVARIINRFPSATILFNYPALIDKMFSEDELGGVDFFLSGCDEPLIF